MVPLQSIPFKYASVAKIIDKVSRAFVSSVLSNKLGFTEDQISCLTDDEINHHLGSLLPFISMSEIEQLLTVEIDQLSMLEHFAFGIAYNNSKEFITLKPLLSIFLPDIPLLTNPRPTTPPPTTHFPVTKTELFAGGTFALVGLVLVWITVKEQLQLSVETLSEYKYSASPNLKGYKGFVETYRRSIKQEMELDKNGAFRAVVPSNRSTADQMTHVQTRRSSGIEISRPDGAIVDDEFYDGYISLLFKFMFLSLVSDCVLICLLIAMPADLICVFKFLINSLTSSSCCLFTLFLGIVVYLLSSTW